MHSPRFKKALFSLALIFAILLNINYSVKAQRRSPGMNADGNLLGGSNAGGGGGYLGVYNWGVTLNTGYEIPLAELKDTYKGAPTFGLTLRRRFKQFDFSLTGDYRSFQPKERSSTYESEAFGQPVTSTLTFSDFRGIGVYLGAAYNMPITPAANFYVGLNGGYIISTFSMVLESDFIALDVSGSSHVPYLGPKIGINVALTNTLSLGAEARYSTNLIKQTDSGKTEEGFDFTMTTKGYSSAAANMTFTYSF